jgi:uncharacterized membrane protein
MHQTMLVQVSTPATHYIWILSTKMLPIFKIEAGTQGQPYLQFCFCFVILFLFHHFVSFIFEVM